jgi:hypothetical protein
MKEAPVREFNDKAVRGSGVSRRQVMQRLLGTAGAGIALPGLAAGHPMHDHLASGRIPQPPVDSTAAGGGTDSDWQPIFFDAHQNETMVVLAERIVPNSGQAQVNRFIDTLIAVDSQDNQKKLLASLGAFDHEAITRYNAPFVALTEEQQVVILTAASTAQASQPGQGGRRRRRPVVPKPGAAEPTLTLRDHFENLKGWISGAYYSSEIGMKELGWTGQTAWDSLPGCPHPDGHA